MSYLKRPIELAEFLKNVCFHLEDFVIDAVVKHLKSLQGHVTIQSSLCILEFRIVRNTVGLFYSYFRFGSLREGERKGFTLSTWCSVVSYGVIC